MKTPSEKGIFPPDGGWKSQTYYAVDVAFRNANVVHRAILFTGHVNRKGVPESGNQIWNPTYDWPEFVEGVYYLRAIAELGDKKTIGDAK